MHYLPSLVLVAAIVLGCVCIGLLIAGVSRKVVIYYDGMDMLLSFSAAMFCVLASTLAWVLEPEESMRWVTLWIVLCLAAIALVLTYLNFRNAIRHARNIPLGLAVGLFRMLFSLLVVVLIADVVKRVFDSRITRAQAFVLVVAFGWLIWLVRRLVNGEDVYADRGWGGSDRGRNSET